MDISRQVTIADELLGLAKYPLANSLGFDCELYRCDQVSSND